MGASAIDPDAAYRAWAAHDARFDGRVFMGVTSTGIYCRPVCRVRLPKREHCRFYANAASAEQAGFRPCLRCRPELAPGLSLVDSSQVLAHHAARMLDHAVHAGESLPLPVLAARLGVTDRHLRRIFLLAHGVSPIDYLTTRRLLQAKHLLTDTTLPVAAIATSCGFASVRRFNAVFAARLRLTPSRLRRAGRSGPEAASNPAFATSEPADAGPASHRRANVNAKAKVTAISHGNSDDLDRASLTGAGDPTKGQARALAGTATAPSTSSPTAAVLAKSERRPKHGKARVPSDVRRGPSAGKADADVGAETSDALRLRLAYRPPYDHEEMLGFFGWLAVDGLEAVADGTLRRSLRVGTGAQAAQGWIAARFQPERHEVHVQVAASLAPRLGLVVEVLRDTLDLDAEPALIEPTLVGLPGAGRGTRVPGGFGGFEAAVRVILGQQVTLAGSRTLIRRLLERFGEPIATPWPEVRWLFPTPQALAEASDEAIGTLGIVRQRVAALKGLARAVHEGRLALHRGAPLASTLATLRELPGLGEWSVQLIAMRALGWPDAWPATDIGLYRALATRDPKQTTAQAEAWRPWRAYAVMRLWQLSKPAA